MDDLISEFLTETNESLAVIDVQMVRFEQNPNDGEILKNIFRMLHTIKGTCGFLGLSRLEKVAHAGENVLGKFRDGALEVTPAAVTLILTCIDTIRGLLGAIEKTGQEPEGDDSQIIAELNAMAAGGAPATAPAAAAPAPAPGGPVVVGGGFPVAKELLDQIGAAEAGNPADAAAKNAAPPDPAQAAASAGVAAIPAAQPKEDAAPHAPAEKKKPATPEKKAEPRESKDAPVAAQSIRVNVQLLENLMTLVSEMVLTRNHLLQLVRGRDDSEFKTPVQRLNLITTDLQEGVMKTRMQPIGNAWAQLPRIVRDLAVETGKKIDLQMIGAETELDRQVLELIKDPLTHMVRNSADHGLEPPDRRAAADKPETGVIKLHAYHEGGHIIIEISDDGRGLNMDKIKKKCIANGLATEAELEAMDERQIQQFILKPGFSTADKVTSVSGRGVGMDVVKTNIEQIGGTIEFHSVEGKGAKFTIKIPLTLAIVSALIVGCQGERFAIPQISVRELVRASNRSEHRIELINEAPVFRLRDKLLPLVSLRDLLKLNGEGRALAAAAGKDLAADQEFFIVVTMVGSQAFGIIVDKVFDTEEIVVKPVAPIIRHIPFYSGNTILGDGSVIMILDPNGIAASARQGAAAGKAAEAEAQAASQDGERTSLLVFRAGGADLKAVPLALVARLEDIDVASIERGGGSYVVQYRGQLMPLIPVGADHQWKDKGRQPILVFTDRGRSMGLVVDEIVDIVDDRLKIEIAAEREGFIGTAVIAGKSTDMIDAGHFLTQAFPDWFGGGAGEAGARTFVKKTLLLIDDSQFFRSLLSPYLSAEGYQVVTVDSAERALKLREDGAMFDAIVSDIEMPGMNGFEFAEAVRKDPRWADVPMIALSSHDKQSYMKRGSEVGFRSYVAKVKRQDLLRALEEIFMAGEKAAEPGEWRATA